MAQPSDVTSLLREAARAETLESTQRYVAAADAAQREITAQAAAERDVDLGNAIIRDHLTPVAVHEHHTAATDWVGGIDTSGGAGVEQEMIAQATLWYQRLHVAVRSDAEEFEQQAAGMGRRLAGAFGEQADAAEHVFLGHVETMRAREEQVGLFAQAGADQAESDDSVHEFGGLGVGPNVDYSLGADTSSERAPAMQMLENQPAGDNGGWSQPLELPQHDVDAANGDAGTSRDRAKQGSRKEPSMQQHTAACPACSGCSACGGTHRVAVRTQAASGLDQLDQIVDPHDQPKQTPYPTEVAFEWEMAPGQQGQAIAETEQQLRQREQLKGATRRRLAERVAHQAAQTAYRQIMTAGYDDSGWAGDMGAGGWQPGMQDTGNPGPPDSLGYTDPVYGQGGDQGQRDLQPYGEDEANDYTNNPGQNWQPGQPTQADMAGAQHPIGSPVTSARATDPEIAKALRFIQQREAFLAGNGR